MIICLCFRGEEVTHQARELGPGKDGDGARGARGVFDGEAERDAGGCGLVGPALIDAGRRGVTMTWLGFGLGSGEA